MNAMQPPQSIEEIKAGLETTEKGGVRQSIRNCLTVFQRDPLLSGAIAYNILTDRKDIIKPIGFHRESTALNDTDMKYLLLYLEETYGLTNEKKIDNAIGIVANENKYHPIRDYLSALVWDGTERIRFCLRHFLGADADDYTYEALKLFLLGAVSRAFQPGCKFEIMLCLVGGQGAGKSTFFRLLAVRDEWFSDDLRKLDDDNVYRKLQGHWIIEMSEMMATANAKSMLVIQDQVWGRVTANRTAGKSTRYYADEFHLLLKEEQTAAYSVEIWKRFRKWGGIPTGLTQNVKDLLSSREVENIFENSDMIIMLNQAAGDRQILAKQLNISPHQLSYVTHSGEGEGLLFFGNVILPFVDRFPTDLELYRIMTTKLGEVSEGAQK